jgi:hypothetical protein
VGSVLMSVLEHTEWGYGRILGGFEGSFQLIPDLMWELAPKINSSMICSTEICPKGSPLKFIWYCLHEECFSSGSLGAFCRFH